MTLPLESGIEPLLLENDDWGSEGVSLNARARGVDRFNFIIGTPEALFRLCSEVAANRSIVSLWTAEAIETVSIVRS